MSENKRIANLSNLVATDRLGRKLPEYGEVSEKRAGKVVALFYYLWQGYHGTHGPYDISKILAEDPDAMQKPDSPLWPDAANAPMLHWGEPMFGYYLSEDDWVLRRHAQMFIDAGVDVLFFDVTNGFSYRKAYTKLFDILTELNAQGFAAPKVAFYTAPGIRGCGTGNMMDLWEYLYEPGLYSELYFKWKGKPLIICHPNRSMPDKVRDFFTWRAPTWCDPQAPNTWAWEGNPQKVAVDENGEPEEIAVNVCRTTCDPNYEHPEEFAGMGSAAFGVPVIGRSWHDGKKDERENASHYGFQFEEQAQNALKLDPPVAFLCEWNEWLVPFLTKATNTLYSMLQWIRLQDEFNEEYSRDLEPMKGGYGDAYYMHMISFIRRFKGMEKPAVCDKAHTVDIAGSFDVWSGIYPEYREYVGDTAPRNFKAYDAMGKYENYTGRNEFSKLKVAADDENVYFYAECVKDISPAEDKNRMMLFISTHTENPKWEGYSFVVNRLSEGSLEKCKTDGVFDFEKTGDIRICTEGNKMHLAIPRSKLCIGEGNFRLAFKWSDNMQENTIEDFYINGDAAPRGRLNYEYIFEI